MKDLYFETFLSVVVFLAMSITVWWFVRKEKRLKKCT